MAVEQLAARAWHTYSQKGAHHVCKIVDIIKACVARLGDDIIQVIGWQAEVGYPFIEAICVLDVHLVILQDSTHDCPDQMQTLLCALQALHWENVCVVSIEAIQQIEHQVLLLLIKLCPSGDSNRKQARHVVEAEHHACINS